MRMAYADPPYLGSAVRYYGAHPEAAVYDTIEGHQALIERLTAEFPDGWALSMGSAQLRPLLPLCPDDVRVAAWCKPYACYKPNVNPGYAWEPVVYRGGRKRTRYEPTVPDWTAVSITLQRGVVGAKPDAFCFWLFELLNLHPEDELVDLFPGSGGVQRAWAAWKRQRRLPLRVARP